MTPQIKDPRLAGGARGGASIPFECCSRSVCGRPRAVCRQRLTVADQEEFPPCPESLL